MKPVINNKRNLNCNDAEDLAAGFEISSEHCFFTSGKLLIFRKEKLN